MALFVQAHQHTLTGRPPSAKWNRLHGPCLLPARKWVLPVGEEDCKGSCIQSVQEVQEFRSNWQEKVVTQPSCDTRTHFTMLFVTGKEVYQGSQYTACSDLCQDQTKPEEEEQHRGLSQLYKMNPAWRKGILLPEYMPKGPFRETLVHFSLLLQNGESSLPRHAWPMAGLSSPCRGWPGFGAMVSQISTTYTAHSPSTCPLSEQTQSSVAEG